MNDRDMEQLTGLFDTENDKSLSDFGDVVIEKFNSDPGSNTGSNNSQKTLLTRSAKGIEGARVPAQVKRTLIDGINITLNPVIKGFVKYSEPKEFIERFFEIFNYLNIDIENKKEFSSQFYNHGFSWSIPNTDGAITLKMWDPARANDDDDFDPLRKYLNQKIGLELNGNTCQALREMGLLEMFMIDIAEHFTYHVSAMDLTLDLFNLRYMRREWVSPKSFLTLYQKHYYVGRAKVYTAGDGLNPTVYIGSPHGSRTIMLYDKYQENKDNGVDEPELFAAVEKDGGHWLRVEQHFKTANNADEAHQVFEYLIADGRDGIQQRINEMLYTMLSSKCRFTSKQVSKNNKHKEKIPTNEKWLMILNAVKSNPTDFVFERHVLTLEERKWAFINGRSNANLGKLTKEVLDEQGIDEVNKFLDEIKSATLSRLM